MSDDTAEASKAGEGVLEAPFARGEPGTDSKVKDLVPLLELVVEPLGRGAPLLAVWQVGLSRVREDRQHGGDLFGRGSFAGRDHDEKLDEVIIDMAAAGLDNVDILLSDGVLDGHGGLAVAKLDKVDLALV